jgi:uncharacterized damage-inducible protein DinB
MIHSIKEFETFWKQQSSGTRKVFAALTDQSLAQRVTPEDRTIGRVAWHIVGAISEMGGRTGLKLAGPKHDDPVPKTAKEILDGYDKVAGSLLEQVQKDWNDKTLEVVDDMYGEKWPRGLSLRIIIDHETHHRGQLTVLMRQAGLKVPGVFGPSREEWAAYGAPPPEI